MHTTYVNGQRAWVAWQILSCVYIPHTACCKQANKLPFVCVYAYNCLPGLINKIAPICLFQSDALSPYSWRILYLSVNSTSSRAQRYYFFSMKERSNIWKVRLYFVGGAGRGGGGWDWSRSRGGEEEWTAKVVCAGRGSTNYKTW